jgi:hypothetical protein
MVSNRILYPAIPLYTLYTYIHFILIHTGKGGSEERV